MPEFNLVDEPWIPCVDGAGGAVELGIRDTLLRADDLREVFDSSPLVTVALHRLLLAILYRAHEGPRNYAEWRRLYQRKTFDAGLVEAYLDRWRDRFDLFDETYPFYQMGGLETVQTVTVARLALESASGNKSTLFDHSTDSNTVRWAAAQAARQLVAYQSFALGFGKSSAALVGGQSEPRPYFADAIALRGMNVWLQRGSLFATLMANLVPSDDRSLPPWELDQPHRARDQRASSGRKAVSAEGVVDRFTWQSRLIRLLPEDRTVSRLYMTQGRAADKSPGDPMQAYRTNKSEGISALSLKSDRAAWRDAHAILLSQPPDSSERRPECLNLAAWAVRNHLVSPETPYYIQIVGLASEPNKAGKFLLWRHERMPVPASILTNSNLVEEVGVLSGNAENAAVSLYRRSSRLAKLYLSPSSDSSGSPQPDRDVVRNLVDAIDPRPAYWARMEPHFLRLLQDLPGDWDAEAEYWRPEGERQAAEAWLNAVKSEATRALQESVRSLGTTARAIQAVARVRTDFTDYDLGIKSTQEEAKTHELV